MSEDMCMEAPSKVPNFKFKVKGTLKPEMWNAELERFLFLRNGNIVASKDAEIEYEECDLWRAERLLRFDHRENPFNKVIIETLY